MKPNILALMRIVICGACAALAKMLSTSPIAHRMRIGQVEALAVEALLVCDVVHRVDDESRPARC
jgi:hypothetical protein